MTTPGLERVLYGVACTEGQWRADGPLREFLVRKFLRHQGYVPNLAAPSTFNEKLLHRMLFDRTRILTIFADKLAVRDYVAQRLEGIQNLTAVYGIFSREEDLDSFDFPSRFALKANHGSDWNYIHHGGQFSRIRLVQLSRRWLKSNYGKMTGEWCYNGIKPKVFCEEYLGDGYRSPVDYKFFCFSGIVRFFLATFDRESGRKINFYDRDRNLLDVRVSEAPRKFYAPPPPNLAQMISIAERLSQGIDFVRVDLYDIEDRVVFGEMTANPGGLANRYYPQEWDATFGSYWQLTTAHMIE
jgi:hypothetical protein